MKNGPEKYDPLRPREGTQSYRNKEEQRDSNDESAEFMSTAESAGASPSPEDLLIAAQEAQGNTDDEELTSVDY